MQTVIHVPTPSQTVRLLLDKEFIEALNEAIWVMQELCKHFGWSEALAVRYAQMRYKQGMMVKDIQQALGLSRYDMYWTEIEAHWYIWKRLELRQSKLAVMFGRVMEEGEEIAA